MSILHIPIVGLIAVFVIAAFRTSTTLFFAALYTLLSLVWSLRRHAQGNIGAIKVATRAAWRNCAAAAILFYISLFLGFSGAKLYPAVLVACYFTLPSSLLSAIALKLSQHLKVKSYTEPRPQLARNEDKPHMTSFYYSVALWLFPLLYGIVASV